MQRYVLQISFDGTPFNGWQRQKNAPSVQQEIEENPALEGGKDEKDEYDSEIDDGNELIETDINIDEYLSDDETPNYKLSANNYSPDDEDKQIPYASGTSFNQYLLQQLNTYRLDEEEKEIARFLVGSVDEGGYIRRDLIDIVDDLAFTQNIFTTEEEIVKIIKIVQNLDPAGVGAKNLQECLLIQLKRKNTSEAILITIRSALLRRDAKTLLSDTPRDVSLITVSFLTHHHVAAILFLA